MTTGARIKQARLAAGLTQTELADKIGVKFSAIHKYETGMVKNLKRDTIAALARALDVKPSWLMCMDDPEQVSDIIQMPIERDEREIDPIWDGLNEDGQTSLCEYGNFLLGQEKYRAKETPKRPVVITRIIPLLGQSFAAGSPETPGDLFMQDYHTTDPRAEFAIHVNGNSMEPYLADGSVALGIKRKPMDGEVGAFWLDGGFLVKQVCQDSQGNIYLFSLNREREDADETIWHDSGRDLRCVGTILMDEKVPLP